MNNELIYRIIFSNEDDKRLAEEALELNSDDFDYDEGDRMMISEDGLQTLEESEIDYDEV